jgi:tRNA ligase
MQHRHDLRELIKGMDFPVRLLAFNWTLDKPPAMIHRICAARILDRGDNHQTLRADAEAKQHEGVIWLFLNNYEEFEEGEADETVDFDIEEDIEQSLARAVDACVRILGLPTPSSEEVGKALAAVRGYTVPLVKDDKPKAKQKKKEPRYYGLVPEVDLASTLRPRLGKTDVPPLMTSFWKELLSSKRITNTPHITLVHKKGLPEKQVLWDACAKMGTHMFSFSLSHVVCDKRVMAIVVKDLRADANPGQPADREAVEFAKRIRGEKDIFLHITVGTKDDGVNPYEAHTLAKEWQKGTRREHVVGMPLMGVTAKGRVKGMFG